MSEPLLATLVSNTLLAAALGGLGWCVAHLARRPATAHALFAVALLKLATPPLWTIVLVPADAAPRPGSIAFATDGAAREPRGRGADRDADAALATTAPVPAPERATRPSPVATPSAPARRLTLGHAAIAVWAAGAALALAVGVQRGRRLRAALAAASYPDARLRADLATAMHRAGVRRGPRVRVVAAAVPPLVFAAGIRATLVVPGELFARLDRAARVALLTHELAHVRRGDVWLRWVETAIRIALWWHPLCWWLARELRAAEERACDAAVTADAPPVARRRYAEALLAAAAGDGPTSLLASPAAGRRDRLRPWKRRLDDIMNARTASRSPRITRLAILALGCLLTPLTIAQERGAPRQGLAERLETTEIEFAIADAGVQAWAEHLANTARLNIVVERSLAARDAGAGPRGALRLPRTSVRRVLDVLATLTDVRWSIEGDILRLRAADHGAGPVAQGDARTVTLHGAVVAPGRVALGADETLLDLVARIERTGAADLSAVRVLRTGAAPVSVVVDVDGMLRTGDTAQNLVLRSGDFVTVPDRLPADLPPLTLRPGVEVRFVVDPQVAAQPGMEQLALLTERQRVQRDGTIFVPYVGPLAVGGMTRDEVTAAVDASLASFFSVPVKVWARLD